MVHLAFILTGIFYIAEKLNIKQAYIYFLFTLCYCGYIYSNNHYQRNEGFEITFVLVDSVNRVLNTLQHNKEINACWKDIFILMYYFFNPFDIVFHTILFSYFLIREIKIKYFNINQMLITGIVCYYSNQTNDIWSMPYPWYVPVILIYLDYENKAEVKEPTVEPPKVEISRPQQQAMSKAMEAYLRELDAQNAMEQNRPKMAQIDLPMFPELPSPEAADPFKINSELVSIFDTPQVPQKKEFQDPFASLNLS